MSKKKALKKKSVSKNKKPSQKGIKILEQEKWEDNKYVIEAGVVKSGKTEGVAVRTAKKYSHRAPIWRKSFYIQKDQKVSEILNWLFATMKKFFLKFWGKKIITKEDIRQSNREVEELRKKLKEQENENSLLKEAFENRQKELQLAYEVIDNIKQYSKILNGFEAKVKKAIRENKRIEELVKKELKKNRWILGLDCEVKAKNKKIDTQTEIDLHIITNYGEERIIEVKSPNIDLFTVRKKGGRFNINHEIAIGLSELIEYMRRTGIYSALRQRGTYGIDKPIGRILAGYKLSRDQEEILNEWNFYLGPYIKIITFEELIKSAKKEIDLLETAKKAFKDSKK